MKDFTLYDESLAMKELGFNEHCFLAYGVDKKTMFYGDWINGSIHPKKFCSAPLYSQAFRWFRKKHNLHCAILYDNKGKYDIVYGKRIGGSCLGQYETYEEAELACLRKLIEIVKNKQHE